MRVPMINDNLPVYVTDTNPLLWYLSDASRLSPATLSGLFPMYRGPRQIWATYLEPPWLTDFLGSWSG